MSIPYDQLDTMVALPQAGDVVFVVRESQDPKDTELLPWEVLETAWISPAATSPSAVADPGSLMNVQVDTEYLYVRNGTQWQRLPFEASNWNDTYNRLLRPVAPHLASEPVGAPDGHFFYDTTAEKWKVQENGSYTSILASTSAYTQFTDGTTTATADGTAFKFRSNDLSIDVTVLDDDVTHGDHVNLEVDPAQINVGDFVNDATYALAGHNHTGTYLEDITGENFGDLADVTLTAIVDGEIARYNGVGWINNTLAEAGIAAASHTHAGTYAPLVHVHDAGDVTTGTFADGRIASTNVTQHQALINHDALLNYDADQHVDHSTVSIATAVGSGLTGGGDLTLTRNLAVNISDVTETVVIDLVNDFFIIHDTSAGGIRKVAPTHFGFDVANHTHTAAQTVSGVFTAERGALGANAAAFNGILKMSGGVASVAVAGVDYLDGTHTHLAADVTDFATAVAGVADVVANTAARHTQNTDIGTTSTFFGFDTGGTAGRVYWNSGTGEFRLRDATNSNYVSLRVNDLFVEGGLTEIVSNEVNIGDSILLLNADLTLGAANSDGGFDVKLLDADNATRRDVGLRYNTTSRRWTGSGFRPTTENPVTRNVAAVWSELVGNGVSQNYNVNHQLRSTEVVVSVVVESTGEAVLVDWNIVDEDNIQVSFGAASIPAASSHRVTVVG